MKTVKVTFVRIYLSEADHQLEPLLGLLHDQEHVAGVTAFRGIAGFGQSGRIHSTMLLDVSLDLPLIIEFFDRPKKVAAVMQHLNPYIKPGHMVSWSGQANLSD